MSKKSKKKAAAREAAKMEIKRQAEKKREPVRMSRKKIIVISVISLVLIAAFVLGLVAIVFWQKDLDYTKDNLSPYIKISEKDYKNYTLELIIDGAGDRDVERKIMSLRYQNRKSAALYNGGNIINLNLPINVGDKVKIYYRGYTVDESGNETEISGASNLFGSVSTLEIGSLGFIPGFEESLVGIKPNDYPAFEYKSSGSVEAGDVIYLSYKAMLPDGTSVSEQSKRIDLSSANTDAVYGIGFKEWFTGASIGKKLSESVTFALDGGSAVYFDMTVNYATGCEQNPLTVDAYFPADYQETSLRGLEVKFDVYFEEVIAYEAPEYNESFITETLGVTAEELASYEGASIVEKHRAMLRAEAEEEYAETRKAIIEEAVWEYLHSKVTVKKLPESEVSEVYYDYYNEIQSAYQNYYSSFYESVDEFAVAYLGLAENADWRAHITENAEEIITEKLLFYYITRKEGLVPSKDEFNTLYDEAVQDYLNYYTEQIYNDELAAIENEALKQERILQIKDEMLDYYGEEYFRELVYYNFALDDLVSFANIVEK